jgi:hypothetical protein
MGAPKAIRPASVYCIDYILVLPASAAGSVNQRRAFPTGRATTPHYKSASERQARTRAGILVSPIIPLIDRAGRDQTVLPLLFRIGSRSTMLTRAIR